jgi:hypothetical protein
MCLSGSISWFLQRWRVPDIAWFVQKWRVPHMTVFVSTNRRRSDNARPRPKYGRELVSPTWMNDVGLGQAALQHADLDGDTSRHFSPRDHGVPLRSTQPRAVPAGLEQSRQATDRARRHSPLSEGTRSRGMGALQSWSLLAIGTYKHLNIAGCACDALLPARGRLSCLVGEALTMNLFAPQIE